MKKTILLFLLVIAFRGHSQEKDNNYIQWEQSIQNGNYYFGSQELDEAIKSFKTAYEIALKIFEIPSNEFMTSAYSYAIVLNQNGNDNLAEEPMKKALTSIKSLYGETHDQYAGALTIMANIYVSNKKYKLAKEKYLESKTLLKFIYGDKHMQYGVGLTNLAAYYREIKNFKKALEVLNEGLAILKDNPEFPEDYYNNLRYNNLPDIYLGLGKLDKALEMQKESLKYLKSTSGSFTSNYANILTSIGGIHLNLGNFNKAQKVLLQGAEIFEGINKRENDKALGNVYMFLAGYYTEITDYESAFTYINKAIPLTELDPSNPKVSHLSYYEILANLNWKLENFPKVAEYINISINLTKASVGDDAPSLPILLSRLGMCYAEMGNIEKATELTEEAFNKLKVNNYSIKDKEYRTCLDNQSILLVYQEKYGEAISNLKKILQEENKNYPNYWLKNIDLANVYLMSNQCNEALTILDNSLPKIRNFYGENDPNYISTLNSLIRAKKCLKKYGSILKDIKEASALTKGQLLKQFSFSTDDLKRYFLIEIEDSFNLYEGINLELNNNELSIINLENKFLLKGLLLNQSKNIISRLKSLEEDSINKKIDDYLDNKQFLNQLQDKDERFEITAEEIESTVSKYEIELVQLYNNRFKDPIDFKKNWLKVKQELKNDEVAVEFSRFNFATTNNVDSTYYVAYIIKKDYKYPKVIKLFEESQLLELFKEGSHPNTIYNLRGSIADTNNKKIESKDLYQLIWQPLEKELSTTKSIYYSPAGLLYNISFASISKGEKLLVDNYKLTQLSSTYKITNAIENPSLNNILLMGGIDYDYKLKETRSNQKEPMTESIDLNFINRSERNNTWNYLPGTLTELEGINNLLNKKEIEKVVLVDTNATEETFKSFSGKSQNIIHIATHGFFFKLNQKKEIILKSNKKNKFKTDNNPLKRSGLILSGGNYAWKNGSNPHEKENGIITANEISLLDLANTKMVILSACETGLGDIEGSEGVYGLQRAFKMAGVDLIMMSLWKVPDKETAEFMNTFYTKWLNGQDVRNAFRNTQLEMSKKYINNPEKWAAFVLFE